MHIFRVPSVAIGRFLVLLRQVSLMSQMRDTFVLVIDEADGDGNARLIEAAGKRKHALAHGVVVVTLAIELPLLLLHPKRRPSGPKAPEVRRRFTNMLVAVKKGRNADVGDEKRTIIRCSFRSHRQIVDGRPRTSYTKILDKRDTKL
jgi:hypothetical protein